MLNSKNILMGLGATLLLAGCAQCPSSGEYYNTPYDHERTAGAGVASYGGHCPVKEVRTEIVQVREEIVETPAPAPAPAPLPVAQEPVFRQQQTK